jgi:hypothetical protein
MSVKRLVPLHAVALQSDPANSRIGDLYYNTTENALKYYDGTVWNLISGGAITGLLDHIHTYDGQIFSVSDNQIPSNGTIDGGSAFSDSGNLPGASLDGGTP